MRAAACALVVVSGGSIDGRPSYAATGDECREYATKEFSIGRSDNQRKADDPVCEMALSAAPRRQCALEYSSGLVTAGALLRWSVVVKANCFIPQGESMYIGYYGVIQISAQGGFIREVSLNGGCSVSAFDKTCNGPSGSHPCDTTPLVITRGEVFHGNAVLESGGSGQSNVENYAVLCN